MIIVDIPCELISGNCEAFSHVHQHQDILDNDYVCPEKYWGYISYKHIPQIFSPELHPQVYQTIDWSHFGIDGSAKDSTFWFGTASARTQLHYDNYGWNLVAQLHGRKRWTLFPPEDTSNLYPTRVPYEESSVFSSVNINYPDLLRHPLYAQCKPLVYILNPGDVLYVPRHWWHDVECLETSVSVNIWRQDSQDDPVEQKKEFLVISDGLYLNVFFCFLVRTQKKLLRKFIKLICIVVIVFGFFNVLTYER